MPRTSSQVRLGAVQETLFITLAARARETQRKHPVLRDPRAVELLQSIDYDAAKYGRSAGGFVTVLRTAIIDFWVREFLAAHPAATVVELGTGLNTRFERVDNGQVHWFDLDLPDTIELRRNFFADTGRRRMVAASALDEDWLPAVAQSRGPYFFVAEGVLVYLPEDQVMAALARIAARFPGALVALDTYPRRTFDQQHKLAARKGMDARWAWACDDPRSLERFGLEVRQSATITRPPRAMRAQLPFGYRYLVPLADPFLGKAMTLTLFRASSPAAGGHAATAPDDRAGAERCRIGIAEPVLAPGAHRFGEFHVGEEGRPVARPVPGAEVAMVQLHLCQPAGQQLGGGKEIPPVQHAHRDLPPCVGQLPGHGTQRHRRARPGRPRARSPACPRPARCLPRAPRRWRRPDGPARSARRPAHSASRRRSWPRAPGHAPGSIRGASTAPAGPDR